MNDGTVAGYQDEIAVIGMACRFPGARNVQEFWNNLQHGVESISFFSDQELLAARVDISLLKAPNYVKAGAIVENIEMFDAACFGFTPREAQILDPQERLFLECAWEALENAGYDSEMYKKRIGLYAGAGMNSYWPYVQGAHPEFAKAVDFYQAMISNDKDYLTTRTAYKLNLKGPCVTVQTACSTSLVAIHMACQSLLNGECSMALAGGVSIRVPQKCGYMYTEGGILSPDGHCRAFDADAQGTVGGSGAGVVVLKRLEDALAEGDTLYAVVKSSAVNNDGSLKVGYTAPSVEGQAEVIAEAQAVAEIDPETITYIEAHGTGTPVGDPIEIAALTQAFRHTTLKKGFCALGSVKTNIGHLDTAAGVAGFIKTVLALYYRLLPPTLHFKQPNPKIDFANSPFSVQTAVAEWKTAGMPRRAGVSSFGIGGTNAHVILEEAPEVVVTGSVRPSQLLILSAKTDSALKSMARRLGEHLKQNPELHLADVAYTLQVGRRCFPHRQALICHNLADAANALIQQRHEHVFTNIQDAIDRTVVFAFPGQGAQYVQMAKELYLSESVFRDQVDLCSDLLKPSLGLDVRDVIYPEKQNEEIAARQLKQTSLAQSALFVIEFALAKLWMEWGVSPSAMIGHSIGEYVAATLSGVLSLEDALALVAERGKMMQRLPEGAMLAISLSEEDLSPLLNEQLSLAAVNGSSRCVVSGPEDAMRELENVLAHKKVPCRRLHTSHAFHSNMIDTIVEPFTDRVREVELRCPKIPYVSNLTGTWIKATEAMEPSYWARHLRHTVRFAEGINLLVQELDPVLLEVGPGEMLSSLVKQYQYKITKPTAFSSLRHPHNQSSDSVFLLKTLGQLWLAGVRIDWPSFSRGMRRRHIPLPTYPFERKPCWPEAVIPHGDSDNTQDNGSTFLHTSVQPLSVVTEEQEIHMVKQHAAASRRRQNITAMLRDMFANSIGVGPEEIDEHATFLEMGADSLFLLQFSRSIEDKFKESIPFRLLLEECSTITMLSEHLDRLLPAEQETEELLTTQPVTPTVTLSTTPQRSLHSQMSVHRHILAAATETSQMQQALDGSAATITATGLERIMSQQLQVMSQQLEALGRIGTIEGRTSLSQVEQTTSTLISTAPTQPHNDLPWHPQKVAGDISSRQVSDSQLTPSLRIDPETYVPYQPIQKAVIGDLTPQQRRHVAELTERLTKRTQGSKQLAQTYRPYLADSRNTADFSLALKETSYPLVVQRAAGSHVWDVDNNEYLDINMGFSALLFGHSPSFLVEVLEEQTRRGMRLGLQSDVVGKVARLISELTGVERVAFCNSGTEAVMASLRLARTVTRRSKIALFAGSYHGTFDGILARAQTVNGSLQMVPMVPGVPPHMVEDVIVLNFGESASVSILKEQANELAAVLVELPQSRRPDLQPKQFVQELRKFTQESGIALIFDEVITGFRCHPGGAQAVFDVRADLITYGKSIGGGLPIGVVAGRAMYMDAIDGGMWNYGDGSSPQAVQTFYAGTYFQHPLIMPVVWAVLNRMKECGPELQEHLNRSTARLVERLNNFFEREDVAIRVTYFCSIFRFVFPPEWKRLDANLFFKHLLEKGIYISETRGCYWSTVHTDEDMDHLVRAVEETVAEMRAGGFLSEPFPRLPGGGSRPSQELDRGILEECSVANVPTSGTEPTNTRTNPDAAPASARSPLDLFGKRPGGNLSREVVQPAFKNELPPIRMPQQLTMKRFPLTAAQKELWFLSKLGEEASRAFNQPITLLLRGQLNLKEMQNAIREIIQRHEALRTTFSTEEAYQQIFSNLAIEVPLIDLSGVSEAESEVRVPTWLEEEFQRPFDLRHGPLMRVYVIKLDEQSHLLSLIIHHIIADGWSMTILLEELSKLYSAACQGTSSELPVPMQYSEYVQWQVSHQETPMMKEAEAYWEKLFAGPIPILELPTDLPRPVIKTFTGGWESATISHSLGKALEQLSLRQNCTLYTTLLAAFGVLLSRLSGQAELIVAIPTAGQLSIGNGYLVGHCVHLLPLRLEVIRNLPFVRHLSSVRKPLLDSFHYQDYPFIKLIEKLKLQRDASRMPLITVSFNFDRTAEIHFHDLKVETVPCFSKTTQYDIVLNIRQTANKLDMEWKYNADLFDDTTIQRWIGHFQTLLESIVADPAQAIADLPLLTLAERRELFIARNNTHVDFPPTPGFHRLFEAQVARTPTAIAVEDPDGQLTYRELDCRANQLAHYLQIQGIGPEVRVGVCLRRSHQQLIALLAIFKAGGAFVPLDPQFPPERQAYMLTDARASLLLTQQELVGRLPLQDLPDVRLLCLDSQWNFLAHLPDSIVESQATAENLAYIMYTSGSTGKPKGVLVPHRGLLNYLLWCAEAYGAAHGRGAPVQSSIAADAIFPSLFAPLLVGATVVFLPESSALESLKQVLQERGGFSLIKITPTQLEVLNQQIPADADATGWVRTLVVGAEALRGDILDFWQLHAPGTIILNEYGPTETVVGCSIYHVPTGQLINGPVPIGLPIANTQFYVLDAQMQLVPIGVVGELYIGGAGVAWGYLNYADLTAERFVPDPFSAEPGARLYKTGDLVRYLPDRAGNIEFVGRTDQQVKIRGYRVELGEIEATLAGHPAVEQTVVIAREEAGRAKQLVAYVVATQQAVPTVPVLRDFVQQKLPDYMIPAAFVFLKSLPLTTTGKVDLAALPAPDRVNYEVEETMTAPRTPIEETLAEIWKQVLGLDKVGVHDNFFELGGHSLLAAQVISRIRRAFKVELPLQNLFLSPTIEKSAEYIENQQDVFQGEKTLGNLLEKVKRLSDDEIGKMLQR